MTAWLVWFLDVYIDACRSSSVLIKESLARARFWVDHRAETLNDMQRRVLNKMLDAGPGRLVARVDRPAVDRRGGSPPHSQHLLLNGCPIPLGKKATTASTGRSFAASSVGNLALPATGPAPQPDSEYPNPSRPSDSARTGSLLAGCPAP